MDKSKFRNMSDKKVDKFKLFHIQECRFCQVYDKCPYKDKDKTKYCPYEEELYEEFMNGLEKEYIITPPIRILAQSVIYNLILAWRIAFMLKIRGLEEEAQIYKDGETIEILRENILKSGLHLDYNRVIRMLKELRLTPKEKSPQEKRITIKQQIIQLKRELEKNEYPVPGGTIKVKKKNVRA